MRDLTMRPGSPARAFPTAPLPALAWLSLWGLGVAMLAGSMLVSAAQATPAPARLVPPFLAALLLAGLLLALRRRRIVLDGDTLVVAATLFTKRVRVAALDLDRARTIDPDDHTDFRPAIKTARFALPGLRAGHYRLRDRAKAFCLLIGRERVLVLPQRDGAVLLLSPDRPQALLDALRQAAAVRRNGSLR